MLGFGVVRYVFKKTVSRWRLSRGRRDTTLAIVLLFWASTREDIRQPRTVDAAGKGSELERGRVAQLAG